MTNQAELHEVPRPHETHDSRALAALVADEVARQLERERTLIRNVGGIAIKVIGAAFAAFLALMTALGFATWKEIKTATAAYVQRRADELVLMADQDTGVKTILNDLVNRTIASAALTSLERTRAAQVTSDLTANEWQRLREWIRQEHLSDQDFSDVIELLSLQAEDRRRTDANGFLSEMLNPPSGSPYAWMVKQPEKRLAILTGFIHSDLGTAALELALSDRVARDLRISAIRYIRQIRFTDGFDKLLAMATVRDDGELRREAFATCAALNPTDPQLAEALGRITSAEPNVRTVRTAAAILVGQWIPEGQRSVEWPEGVSEDEVLASSVQLLKFAFSGGAYIRVGSGDPRLGRTRQNAPSALTRVSLFTPDGGGIATGRSLGTVETFNRFKPYWLLLSETAEAGNTQLFETLFPGLDLLAFSGPRMSVRPSGPAANISIRDASGEETIVEGSALSSMRLWRERRGGPVQAQWTCGENRRCIGAVSGLSGALTFQMAQESMEVD